MGSKSIYIIILLTNNSPTQMIMIFLTNVLSHVPTHGSNYIRITHGNHSTYHACKSFYVSGMEVILCITHHMEIILCITHVSLSTIQAWKSFYASGIEVILRITHHMEIILCITHVSLYYDSGMEVILRIRHGSHSTQHTWIR